MSVREWKIEAVVARGICKEHSSMQGTRLESRTNWLR